MGFQVGFLHGTPVTGTGYNGASDLGLVVHDRHQLGRCQSQSGYVAHERHVHRRYAGDDSGTIIFAAFSGKVATFTMENTVLSAKSTTATAPTVSSGTTPGHLASEHDVSGLKTFPTMTGGKICGNVTAASLRVSVPTAFDGQCNEGYNSTSNSLLDVIVGGSSYDVADSDYRVGHRGDATRWAGSPPVHITMTGTHVTGCTGSGGAYPACLDVATYSSGFTFTTDRVIAK